MRHPSTEPKPRTLVVGFDSAWTAWGSGALVGVVVGESGVSELSPLPVTATYAEATPIIEGWREASGADRLLVMLDQPTIVPNSASQRPVENLVAGPVGQTYGAVQPANTGRAEMFGRDAPVWPFLNRWGGVADPRSINRLAVIETYPVLSLIALGWLLEDKARHPRPTGRLPKYNPARRRTFSQQDWKYVCEKVRGELSSAGCDSLEQWLLDAGGRRPMKATQDGVDACICLIAGLRLACGKRCLMVGDIQSGYMVVPFGDELWNALRRRCEATNRVPAQWLGVVGGSALPAGRAS